MQTAPATPCRSILVVEDDPDIREVLVEVLRDFGYPVSTANNGKEALEALAKSPGPCLILLDLMMPVMNGWEFLEAQKASAIFAALPVVVVSAIKPADERDFLKKPIALNALMELVERHCGPPPKG